MPLSADKHDEWKATMAQLEAQLQQQSLALSGRRRRAAAALQQQVTQCLEELAMGQTRFQVIIRWQPAADEDDDGGGVSAGVSADEAAAVVGQADQTEGEQPLLAGRYCLAAAGLDRVEFRMAAGPAEPLRPLSAVASGGESARVMLALKAAPTLTLQRQAPPAPPLQSLQQAQPSGDVLEAKMDKSLVMGVSLTEQASGDGQSLPTAAGPASAVGCPVMVLDEIDSGIGSRLGQSIGSLLSRMCCNSSAATGQILCVTHLPQVRLW